MTSKTHRRCPECGDRDHLYGRADCRWNHDRQEWVVGDMEDEIECTECDWSGSVEATLFDDGEVDAATPLDTPALDDSAHRYEMEV